MLRPLLLPAMLLTTACSSDDDDAINNNENIVNNTGTVLPETGAQGTFLLISVSTLFVMVAAVFMVTRKKMSIYED